MSYISEDCVILNLAANNSNEAILALAGLLEKKGHVSMRFGPSAVQRESSFPSGVPTEPYAIAFPHAEPSTIYHSSLAIGTLLQPVLFRSMEDPNLEIPVRAVFLLANRRPREHVTALKRLSRFFKKPGNINRLLQTTSINEMVTWLERELFPTTQ